MLARASLEGNNVNCGTEIALLRAASPARISSRREPAILHRCPALQARISTRQSKANRQQSTMHGRPQRTSGTTSLNAETLHTAPPTGTNRGGFHSTTGCIITTILTTTIDIITNLYPYQHLYSRRYFIDLSMDCAAPTGRPGAPVSGQLFSGREQPKHSIALFADRRPSL
jgi:hypothetical protein